MRSPIAGCLSSPLIYLRRQTPAITDPRRLCIAAAAETSTVNSSETRTQKLERIADELLDLNKLELYDYSVLFRLKLGLNRYGPAVSASSAAVGSAEASGSGDAKAAKKTAFDVKLDKFDAAAKIKIIKEIRSFTELGLKDAKDLVEKAPVVVKKGVTKEEAEQIAEKLKAVGATVVLE